MATINVKCKHCDQTTKINVPEIDRLRAGNEDLKRQIQTLKAMMKWEEKAKHKGSFYDLFRSLK